MLTPPDIADARISACLHANFGLRISDTTFLPIGADANSAVYRVTADDVTPYFSATGTRRWKQRGSMPATATP